MNIFILLLPFFLLKPQKSDKKVKEIQKKFEYVEKIFSRYYPYTFIKDKYLPFKRKEIKIHTKNKQDDTIRFNILAIRVAFQREEPDDSLTTGDGWFDLKGKGNPDSVPFFSEPPHDRKYFETYLESLKAFLASVGYGKIKINYVVKPDKNDSFYILPHPMRYYGDPEHFEEGLVKLLQDALHIADLDETINFMDLDNDGKKDYKQGIKDVYIIFHAGSTWQTDWGDTPYDIATVTIPQGAIEYYTGEKYIILNGGKDTVVSGILLPEQPSQDGMEVELQGLLFHEFQHDAFYATDLYGVYGRSSGVGAWCLMGTGGWNEVGSENEEGYIESVFGAIPSFPSAWMRTWFDYAVKIIPQRFFIPEEWYKDTLNPLWGFSLYKGMVDTIIPLQEEKNITIYEATEPASDTINYIPDSVRFPKIIFIPIDDYEYYLIEYRNDLLFGSFELKAYFKNGTIISPYGAWDFLLPGSGLLVWHIDDRTVIDHYWEINAYPPYKGVDLVEADGIQDLDKWTEYPETWYGSEYDPFFKNWKDEFSYNTYPSSKAKSGGNTFIEIKNIGERRKHKISFTLKNSFLNLHIKDYLQEDMRPLNAFFGINKDKIIVLIGGALDYYGDTIPVTDTFNSGFFIFSKDGNLLKSIYFKSIINKPFSISDIDGDAVDEVLFLNEGFLSLIKLNNYDTFKFRNLPKFSSVPSVYDTDKDGIKEIFLCGEDYYLYKLSGKNPDSVIAKGFIGSKTNNGIAVSDDPKVLYILGIDGVLRVFDYDLNKIREVFNPYPGFSDYGVICADFDGDEKKEVMGVRGENSVFYYDYEDNLYYERKINDKIINSPSIFDADFDGYVDIIVSSPNSVYSFNYLLSLGNEFPVNIEADSFKNYYFAYISSDKNLFVNMNHKIISIPTKSIYSVNTSSFGLKDLLIDEQGELYLLLGTGEIKRFNFDLNPFFSCFGVNTERNFLFEKRSNFSRSDIPETRLIIYPSVIKNKRGVIRFFAKKSTYLDLKFYTFSGHLIKTERFYVDGKNIYNDIEFDFSFLTPGPYILKWESLDSKGIFKFFVK